MQEAALSHGFRTVDEAYVLARCLTADQQDQYIALSRGVARVGLHMWIQERAPLNPDQVRN